MSEPKDAGPDNSLQQLHQTLVKQELQEAKWEIETQKQARIHAEKELEKERALRLTAESFVGKANHDSQKSLSKARKYKARLEEREILMNWERDEAQKEKERIQLELQLALGKMTPQQISKNRNNPLYKAERQIKSLEKIRAKLEAKVAASSTKLMESKQSLPASSENSTPTPSADGTFVLDKARTTKTDDSKKTTPHQLQLGVETITAPDLQLTAIMYESLASKADFLSYLSKAALTKLLQRIPTELAKRNAESTNCIVCNEKAARTIFLPCRHMKTCVECSRICTTCPSCDCVISEKFQPV